MKKAYFAGGCFWCITPTFYEIKGVRKVISGYSGGDEADPSYEDVKHQRTGHRETICIEYQEKLVSYQRLLEVFLTGIDPFDEGGQFIDRGRSYTLAIYYGDETEQELAQNALTALKKESGQRPAIALEPFKSFFAAEEYHQDFYRKNPDAFAKELEESGRASYWQKK